MKIPKEDKIQVYQSGPARGMPVLSYFFRCGLLDSDAREFVGERIYKLLDQAHPARHEWTVEQQPYVSAAALRDSLGGEFFSTAQKFVDLLEDMDRRGLIDACGRTEAALTEGRQS